MWKDFRSLLTLCHLHALLLSFLLSQVWTSKGQSSTAPASSARIYNFMVMHPRQRNRIKALVEELKRRTSSGAPNLMMFKGQIGPKKEAAHHGWKAQPRPPPEQSAMQIGKLHPILLQTFLMSIQVFFLLMIIQMFYLIICSCHVRVPHIQVLQVPYLKLPLSLNSQISRVKRPLLKLLSVFFQSMLTVWEISFLNPRFVLEEAADVEG